MAPARAAATSGGSTTPPIPFARSFWRRRLPPEALPRLYGHDPDARNDCLGDMACYGPYDDSVTDLSRCTHAVAGWRPQDVIMNQREWKPAGHRRGVERAAIAILTAAAAVAAAGAITCASVVMVYALA